ncbi:MAG TPA: GNAT family N-acetyltransferase [Acetobacteraceae bacterium]|nr:GNAT family N-acetyltransferase [Acetobacteraceae bacterium]
MEPEVTCEGVRDIAALGAEWRALEAEADSLSFFQSWTWVGCLAEERFPEPLVVRAHRSGRLVGLALFNRRGRRLYLTESGDRVLDAPFVEHNAPVLSRHAGPDALGAMMRAVWKVAGRLVLSGVPGRVAAEAGGIALRRLERLAPFVDLDAVRRMGRAYLDTLSGNARYQIRRSLRRYEARGEVVLSRAEDESQAIGWFEELVALHSRAWQARGEPGAFGEPFIRRFHEALIKRALPRGEVDLLRITAGASVIGLLYNFRLGGWVHAYQSGFDLSEGTPHAKPGLVSHCLAIERGVRNGERCYDFLGGDAQYKRTLASCSRGLHWLDLVSRWSVLGLLRRVTTRA